MCRCGGMVDTGDLKSPARIRASRFKSGRRYQICIMKTLLLLSLLAISPLAYAEQVPIERIYDGGRIEQLLNTATTRATAELSGRGTTMELTYSSPAPLHIIILHLNGSGEFNPLDALVATLPAGTKHLAEVDLSSSPAWHPGTNNYRFHFLSTTAEGAGFEGIEFVHSGIFNTLLAGVKQLMSPLPYTPSSYHRLMSYRVLSVPIVPLAGILMLVISGYYVVIRKYKTAIIVAISITLLLSLRYCIDLAYYSVTHTGQWFGEHTYATAGSLPQIATDLKRESATGVYLCHSGTSYAEKVLAYHLYPIVIEQSNPSHVVVHAADDWSYETGNLHCGSDTFKARKLTEYADGSIVFSVRKL